MLVSYHQHWIQLPEGFPLHRLYHFHLFSLSLSRALCECSFFPQILLNDNDKIERQKTRYAFYPNFSHYPVSLYSILYAHVSIFLAQNCDDVLDACLYVYMCVWVCSIIHLIKLFLLKLNFIIQCFFALIFVCVRENTYWLK